MPDTESLTGRAIRSGRQTASAWLGLIAIAVLAVVTIYAISLVLTGTTGGAVAGGIVGLLVTLVSKGFDFRKQQEAAIAEKKREVYRRLLAPWGRVLAGVKTGGTDENAQAEPSGEALLEGVDMEELYASLFDAILYGSEGVVERFVEFRSPDGDRDPIDVIRAFGRLLIALREDVTGKKATLTEEAVLRMFVNFTPEQLMLVRLREYVSSNPAIQRALAEQLGQEEPNATSTAGKTRGGGASAE